MLIARDPPPLAGGESAQSARVAEHIRAMIAGAGGWLPFSRFMEAALYAPRLGYYMAGRPIFGARGDFVTAPELTPIYGRCVAGQLAELLDRCGGGDVVEFGAGSGALAVHVLAELAARDRLPARYRIVDTSPALRERQHDRLASSPAQRQGGVRIEWLDAPPREAWQGVAVANEVIDALPVDRFRIGTGGVEALGVAVVSGAFAWQAAPGDPALAAAVAAIQSQLPSPMPAGFVSERCPGLPQWIGSATAGMTQGALLVIDYGLPRAQYYHPARDGGTLCGFRGQHRIADVFANPGAQDLTAWVDFSALADAARAAGLVTAGFATQAHFLLSLGIERQLARLHEQAGEHERLAAGQAIATLTHPGEMGERFKAMLCTRGIDGPFAGFSFRDLSESL